MMPDTILENTPSIATKDLLMIEVDAVAEEKGRVNYFTGHLIRGALLHMISRSDPDLVSILHDGQTSRPYSVAPIRLPFRPDQRELLWEIRPGYRMTFRLCSLSYEVNRRIIEGIFNNWSSSLRIGEVNLNLVSVRFESLSFVDIVRNNTGARNHEFKFLSPTKFEIRSESFPMLFPLPTYLFGGLASLWNKFAPEETHIDLDDFIKKLKSNICVTQHAIRTATARIKGHIPITGFVGRARFKTAREAPKDVANIINLLTRFAKFSGVGAKRSFGFGAVNTRSFDDLPHTSEVVK